MKDYVRCIVAIFLIFFCSYSIASSEFVKDLNISASIERSKFYDYGVSKFEFKDEKIKLDYNYNAQKFSDVETVLIIETDIPNTLKNVGFELNVSELNSVCESYDDKSLLASDYAEGYLDGTMVNKGDEIEYDTFDDDIDGKYSMTLPMVLKFKELDSGIVNKSKCSGNVVMVIGLVF
ncbi:hypothetical protein [Vibrio owensii]|uniref:hypothetical protein n=1 Tax=Vibrio owensii TaxID=696485 RepID=UPI0040698D63